MTHGERITLLEAQVAELQAFRNVFVNPLTGQLLVLSGLSVDGLVPYLQFNCRIGVCTNFHQLKALGDGVTFTVGTAIDPCAGYFEVDEESSPGKPHVAVYGAVCCNGVNGKPHIAFQGVAGNAPNDANGLSQNYGLHLTFGDKSYSLQPEGLQTFGTMVAFYIGKVGATIKQLWP